MYRLSFIIFCRQFFCSLVKFDLGVAFSVFCFVISFNFSAKVFRFCSIVLDASGGFQREGKYRFGL